MGTGLDNWTDLPSEVWVQPTGPSTGVRDVTMELSLQGWCPKQDGATEGYRSATHTDTVNLTAVEVTDVAVEGSDPETAEVPSVLQDGMEHFVTAKDQGDVVLEAATEPDDPEVGEHLEWTTSGGVGITSPAVGGDGRTASFSSATADGLKAPLTVRVDGTDAWQGVGWVVWVELIPDYNTQSTELHPNNENELSDYVPGVSHLGLSTPADNFCAAVEWRGHINPDEIVSDSDHPDLEGSLQGQSGASAYWDMTRDKMRRVWIDGTETDENHPTESLRRQVTWISDNGTAVDEDVNPYNGPRSDLGGPATGEVFSFDNPFFSAAFVEQTAGATSTFVKQMNFREWARIWLRNTWFPCSDYESWRFSRAVRLEQGTWEEDPDGQNLIDDSNFDWE